MQLSLQNFTTLVQNMSASAQGACAELTDITVGSVTRALLEASASLADIEHDQARDFHRKRCRQLGR